MKIVTFYKAGDGKIFHNEEEALNYVNSKKSRTIKFSGHSDDIVSILDGDDEDEFSTYKFKVSDGEDTLLVYAHYDYAWHFSVCIEKEDAKLPDWVIRYVPEGYSTSIEIVVPRGTFVSAV